MASFEDTCTRIEENRNEENYQRLHLLVIKYATRVLKFTFDHKIPNDKLHKTLNRPGNKLMLKKRLQRKEFDTLFKRHTSGNLHNSDNFDVSLLVKLLRWLSGVNPKSRWWDVQENNKIPDDYTTEVADIVRIRNLRNKLCHMENPEIDAGDFQRMWTQAEKAILRLAEKCNNPEHFKNAIIEVKTKRHGSRELQKLRERTLRFLQDHNVGNTYIETSAYTKAKDALNKHRFVVLSGHRGEGKTSMCVRLALSVSKPNRTLLLSNPTDWNHIDVSSKLIQTVIIDNLYGEVSLDQSVVANWKPVLTDMYRAASERRIYVIITGVEYILNQSKEEIGTICDLLSSKNDIELCKLSSSSLTQTEKMRILEAHAKKSGHQMSDRIMLECVEHSPSKREVLCGFPQRVREFCDNDQYFALGSFYFKDPFEGFIQCLMPMYRQGKQNDNFLALLLLFAKEDRLINQRELEVSTASQHVKSFLRVFRRPFNFEILETMHLSLKSHVGGFIKYNRTSGDYTFSHSTISDAIGVAFGMKEPAKLLEICPRDFFMQYVVLVDDQKVMSRNNLCVEIKEDLFPNVIDKCCSLVLNKERHDDDDDDFGDDDDEDASSNSLNDVSEYDELKRHGKRGNILRSFDDIDCGVIKHSAFNSRVFVRRFLAHVKKEGLLEALFCKPVLVMSGRFLDYALSMKGLDMNLLGYGLYSGRVEFVEEVLASGILDGKDIDIEMSLILAVHSKEIRLVRLFFDLGARITGDAIHIAICRSSSVLKMLLDQPGTNGNDKGNAVNGNYPLIVAASRGNYVAVQCLLSHSADPGVRNTMNMTALHKAILLPKSGATSLLRLLRRNDFDDTRDKIIDILLSNGAPLDIRGGAYKRTPLHLAVDLNDKASVQKLIDHGASLYVSDKMGQFPIHTAIIRGYTNIVRMLLQSDRNLELLRFTPSRNNVSRIARRMKAMRGFSLFHTAIWQRQSMVDTLIDMGIDPNVKDCYGRSPLLYAIEMTNTDVALSLVRYAKVDKRLADKHGVTPLHLALRNGFDNLAAELLPHSDINAKDKAGETPLHIACSKLNIPAIDGLLRYQADYLMVNNNGDTVFHILNRQTERITRYVVQFLLQLDPKIADCLRHLTNKALNLRLKKERSKKVNTLREYLKDNYSGTQQIAFITYMG